MRRRYRATDRAEQEGRRFGAKLRSYGLRPERLQRRHVCPCGQRANSTKGRLCDADFDEVLRGRVLHDA